MLPVVFSQQLLFGPYLCKYCVFISWPVLWKCLPYMSYVQRKHSELVTHIKQTFANFAFMSLSCLIIQFISILGLEPTDSDVLLAFVLLRD